MRGAACLVCVSQAVERKMAGICPDTPLRVVYNGLDTSLFNAEGRVPAGAGEPLRIMTSGGIRHSKGTFLVVEALSKLSEQHGEFDWRLDIYGGEGGRVGETAEALREMCERLGVAQRVRYLGQTDAIADAYRAHDVLVMASRAEAFGRVTAEAMLCGCAVVGSDSGGTPELIADGRGYLFAPQDADSLAQALVQAAGDPQERQRRVMVAQTYAQEHFGAATYVDAIEGIYYDAIAAARLH
jgi:glycosyltransferase involved in cell wall biosynthesis